MSAKDVFIELNRNWEDLKSVPLTSMIIKNKYYKRPMYIGWDGTGAWNRMQSNRPPNYVLAYVDNKYTVCHLKANANMGHNNIFQAFLFF